MQTELFSAITGLTGTILLWFALDPMLTAMRCGVYANGDKIISNRVIRGYCIYKAFARAGLGLFLLSYGVTIWKLAGPAIVAAIKAHVSSW